MRRGGVESERNNSLTTLAAAFPHLAPRADRATVGPDLGVEPAIRLGEERLDRNERRNASLRWLAGASLACLCGVTLIGAALYLDLDSQYDFAEAPEFAAPPRLAYGQEEGVNPSKGDRLLRPVDIVSDKQTFKVPTSIKVGDKEVKLSPKEYDLLRVLVQHAGKVLTHKFLLGELWDDLTDAQYLRVYVRQLRQKIEADPERPQYVLTETGIGYRLRAPD